jgi:hypothetical protein
MSHYLARRQRCPADQQALQEESRRAGDQRAEERLQGPGLDKFSGTNRHQKGGKTVSKNEQQYAGDRARLEGRMGKRAACGTAP